MTKIRIETKSRKIIERNAGITDYIDNRGRQYSIAMVGQYLYKIAYRDFYGPVYKIS